LLWTLLESDWSTAPGPPLIAYISGRVIDQSKDVAMCGQCEDSHPVLIEAPGDAMLLFLPSTAHAQTRPAYLGAVIEVALLSLTCLCMKGCCVIRMYLLSDHVLVLRLHMCWLSNRL
jgi:hypothetical protein